MSATRAGRRASVGLLVALAVTLALAAGPAGARTSTAAANRALGLTPYMGWDSYFALPGGFDEATILGQASMLASSGLQRSGYRLIWLDSGWWHGTRDATGQISVSAKQWPHGIAWLARTLHAAGFQLGVYTDAGTTGCGEIGAGSYGHYQQDVDTLAAWGIDALKVDYCGGGKLRLDPVSTYAQIHTAILHNASHRRMLLNICNFNQPGQQGNGLPVFGASAFDSYSFGPSDATSSWRTNTDVGTPQSVTFSAVLRNLDADATHPEAAGPGHWNDPDYLGPDKGMSATQFRTQFSMWSMLAAPLMVSANLMSMSANAYATVSNSEMIAIDQDPAGIQGRLASTSATGTGQVWVKLLADGSRAVALLNRGSAPLQITATAAGRGVAAASRDSVRDVWQHTTSITTATISALVPAGATAVYRVSAAS